MAHGDGTNGTGAAFDVVLRGYDRRQVDDHLSSLEGRLAVTAGQCNELRMQRDAAAGRVRELEQRLNGTNAPAGPSSVAPSASPPAAESENVSLDGFGAKVEAILRLASEEAADIRRAAENSGRIHAEAETKLRRTFEGIAERLTPLAHKLEAESKAAHAALPAVTSEAETLEATARKQAETLADAAAVNAARMRADAQSRAELTAQHVADVREELSLVTQILTSLGMASPAAGQQAPGSQQQGSQQQGSGLPRSGAAGSGAAGSGSPEPAARESDSASTGRQRITPPELGKPPGAAGRPLSSDAPTETISLPRDDRARQGSGGAPAAGPNQPPA